MMTLKQFLRATTVDEQHALAGCAGTSRNYLYQLAGGHRNSSKCNPDLVLRIEAATEVMAGEYPDRLETVSRHSLTDFFDRWRDRLAKSA